MEQGQPQDRIVVGVVGGAFGVKGEVRIKSFCADPEAIATYAPLFNQDGQVFGTITLTGQAKNGLLARVQGVDTREQADALRGVTLFAARDRLPSLPDDEYYHADLIGLRVLDTGGTILGEVRAVVNHGATDLLEIQAPGQRETVLLPFTRAVVPTVDLGTGRIIADPPDGLF